MAARSSTVAINVQEAKEKAAALAVAQLEANNASITKFKAKSKAKARFKTKLKEPATLIVPTSEIEKKITEALAHINSLSLLKELIEEETNLFYHLRKPWCGKPFYKGMKEPFHFALLKAVELSKFAEIKYLLSL